MNLLEFNLISFGSFQDYKISGKTRVIICFFRIIFTPKAKPRPASFKRSYFSRGIYGYTGTQFHFKISKGYLALTSFVFRLIIIF
jgi:hypothetical protein